MTSPQLRPTRQTAGVADDFASRNAILPVSRLARDACDQFWAARRAGDRAAMVHWSARESVLRHRTYGLTAPTPLPDQSTTVA
jgi:hypothetical protein